MPPTPTATSLLSAPRHLYFLPRPTALEPGTAECCMKLSSHSLSSHRPLRSSLHQACYEEMDQHTQIHLYYEKQLNENNRKSDTTTLT